ncbi:hypothetical protein ZHAS_00022085 [Anopheles sinensis]|uniref:Uncharacterized protein n=1 Tax=Anopheles sinensis TaxID=74873 RepID=A0A084WU15_ANOSI|nr:hypothetical protein ZHAS_00022085 [Anopheles sinensis]
MRHVATLGVGGTIGPRDMFVPRKLGVDPPAQSEVCLGLQGSRVFPFAHGQEMQTSTKNFETVYV